MNVGLPMILRTLDQGGYETALESLMKARSVVNATLRAVLHLAVSAPEPVSRERPATLRVRPSDLEHWYAGRASYRTDSGTAEPLCYLRAPSP